MKDNPMVSVLIPAFKHENYVQATLKSIIAQTYKNIELIVINDGSPDKTHERIVDLQEQCYRRFEKFIYINQTNRGVAYSQNEGIKMANGKYMFFLASDDTIEPDAISVLVHALENLDASYALACGDSDYIDARGSRIFLDYIGKVHYFDHPEFYSTFVQFRTRHRKHLSLVEPVFGSYPSLLLGNYIPVGLLVKRNALLESGLYDDSLILQDLDMWFNMSKQFKMTFVDRILSHYRIHGQNMVSQRQSLIKKQNLELLLREKKYCYDSGYASTWNLGLFIAMLKSPIRFTRGNFWSYFKHIDLRHLIKTIPGYAMNEIFRIIKIMQCLSVRRSVKNRSDLKN